MKSLLLSLLLPLGSPHYAEREAQTERLERAMPLSLVVTVYGMNDADPEISSRCRKLTQHCFDDWSPIVESVCESCRGPALQRHTVEPPEAK